MNTGDITILSILGVVASALTYIINKWVIPAYRNMREEIKEFHNTEKRLLERIMELEITVATLRERYKETALHSRGKKNESTK